MAVLTMVSGPFSRGKATASTPGYKMPLLRARNKALLGKPAVAPSNKKPVAGKTPAAGYKTAQATLPPLEPLDDPRL